MLQNVLCFIHAECVFSKGQGKHAWYESEGMSARVQVCMFFVSRHMLFHVLTACLTILIQLMFPSCGLDMFSVCIHLYKPGDRSLCLVYLLIRSLRAFSSYLRPVWSAGCGLLLLKGKRRKTHDETMILKISCMLCVFDILITAMLFGCDKNRGAFLCVCVCLYRVRLCVRDPGSRWLQLSVKACSGSSESLTLTHDPWTTAGRPCAHKGVCVRERQVG